MKVSARAGIELPCSVCILVGVVNHVSSRYTVV